MTTTTRSLMDGCKHRPLGNGHSGGSTRDGKPMHPETWCGYCKRSVKVDTLWVTEHYDRRKRRLQRDIDTGYATAGDMRVLCEEEVRMHELVQSFEMADR